MTETGGLPSAPRPVDLFRPGRLYRSLAERPSFVFPLLILLASAIVYALVASGPAIEDIVPQLLEHSQWTESELARGFRWMLLTLALVMPTLFLVAMSVSSWLLLRLVRRRVDFPVVLGLVAHASLWVALGLLAKAALVAVSHSAEPPVNLSLLLARPTQAERVALAFTNPFLILGLVWTVRGLRAWGVGRFAAALAGAGPWVAWIVFSVLGSGGPGGRFAPTEPISYENWGTITKDTVVLRFPPGFDSDAEDLATILDGFTKKLALQFRFDPEPVRVQVYRDHAELERACGEFLHVKVTGSIRGRDLLFLEMPGRSVALPKVDGLHEAIRYIALMHLPFAPGLSGCPRWFVEGIAHAATHPWTGALEEEYRAMLRRIGVPSLDLLLDPLLFAQPEGPLLARSLVDHIAFHYGRDAITGIEEDVAGGASFRDALYARTRLTTSALEAGWQDDIAEMLRTDAGPGVPAPAPPDTGRPADVVPFRPRD